jgi:galactonate dehydratase
MKVLEYYADWIVGRDPMDSEGLWQEMFRRTRRKEGIILVSALSGIDMALWDIKGKSLGVPVWKLLGGKAREQVPLYSHVQAPTLKQTVEKAQESVAAGFHTVRYGLYDPEGGQSFDPRRAIEYTARIGEELRKGLGDEIEISVDVHQRLSPVWGVTFCERVADLGLLFVEDPVRTEDPLVYRQIRTRVPNTPIATGELLYSKWQFRTVIEEELTDYLRIDLGLAGGITEGRKIAAMGETHYLDVVPHCARGPLLEQVSLHFSVATPNLAVQEHTGGPTWWNDVFSGLADFSTGHALPPTGAGWGLEFHEDAALNHPFEQRIMDHWKKTDGSIQDW